MQYKVIKFCFWKIKASCSGVLVYTIYDITLSLIASQINDNISTILCITALYSYYSDIFVFFSLNYFITRTSMAES